MKRGDRVIVVRQGIEFYSGKMFATVSSADTKDATLVLDDGGQISVSFDGTAWRGTFDAGYGETGHYYVSDSNSDLFKQQSAKAIVEQIKDCKFTDVDSYVARIELLINKMKDFS